jgi:hypothetical protein
MWFFFETSILCDATSGRIDSANFNTPTLQLNTVDSGCNREGGAIFKVHKVASKGGPLKKLHVTTASMVYRSGFRDLHSRHSHLSLRLLSDCRHELATITYPFMDNNDHRISPANLFATLPIRLIGYRHAPYAQFMWT